MLYTVNFVRFLTVSQYSIVLPEQSWQREHW